MQSWEREIQNNQNNSAYEIEKSFHSDLLTEKEFNEFIEKGGYSIVDSDYFEKSEKKDLSHLIKKEVWVQRGGKNFRQTVYIKKEDQEETETPIGGELTPTVKGLDIEKYSEKSLIIKGDTYANVDLMRKIKEETGFGSWNKALKGWIFSLNQVDKVLGIIYSDVKEKDEDKAEAIVNQKNASLNVGDELSVSGEKGKVEEVASDNEGVKYNVTLDNGLELKGVNEKVIEVKPTTSDEKIVETISNAQPENRAKTEKKLYGIKPIQDIHKYTLAEYLKMNGLDDSDIQKALNRIKPKDKNGSKTGRTSVGSGGSKSSKEQTDELTKNQLIGKLLYAHYQAVKNAIDNGEELSPEVLELYPNLEEEYKVRKPMSEETKRKIAEALRKFHPEEAEEIKVKKEEEIVVPKIKKIEEEEVKEVKVKKLEDETKISKVAELESQKESMVSQKEEMGKLYTSLNETARTTDNYMIKNDSWEQASKLSPKIKELIKKISVKENQIQAVSNGGELKTITDQTGLEHKDIPDFTKVDSRNIYYDIDTILTEKRPPFVPKIDQEKFRLKGFIIDAIRVDKDTYMVATNGHEEEGDRIVDRSTRDKDSPGKIRREGYNGESSGYVVLTLDQLVLTNDYYTTKQKAIYKKAAMARNQAQVDHWNKFSDEKKSAYYNQRNFYESLPVAAKKKATKEQWNNFSLKEKEELYLPVKKFNPEKLKTTIEDGKMWTSFHEMHERFVDIEAKRFLRGGRKLNLGEREIGSFGHPKVFQEWGKFSEMLNWKLNDIKLQREEYSETRKQAMETSFGESNTNNSLLESDGILVKRQNGDKISPSEVDQLDKAWKEVQSSFGSLKENARGDGLKLSHSGNTYIYASKAAGIYIPSMKTIAVSNKFGEDQFGFTLGHETAHWIDNTLGEKLGKRFASDDFESTAGQIAIAFRKSLNEKSGSDYTNSTIECFARALEQYHAIETKGEGAEMAKMGRYFASKDYAPKEKYESSIKPLIKQFLEENKDILKSLNYNLFS